MTATGRTVVWLTLGVGLVRFGTEVINSISHGPYFNWQGAFSQAYLAIMIQWAATFCGGALYAFLAGHRGRPTLGDCSLGGASVGFGGALLGEVLSGLFLVAVASYRSVDLFLGSLIGCSVLVPVPARGESAARG